MEPSQKNTLNTSDIQFLGYIIISAIPLVLTYQDAITQYLTIHGADSNVLHFVAGIFGTLAVGYRLFKTGEDTLSSIQVEYAQNQSNGQNSAPVHIPRDTAPAPVSNISDSSVQEVQNTPETIPNAQ